MNDTGRPRVLIVDDDDELAEAIAIRLSAAGYECETAANGEEGFSRFQARRIDLVITDVIMPMSDGFSMVEWIRQISDVPVIVISGYPQSHQAFLSDFPDIRCITKPYNAEELLALVEEELTSRRGTPAAMRRGGDSNADVTGETD